MNEKNIIRLTESQLREMISESVKKVLNENNKSFDFKKELLRLTQNYLRELYGYAEGYRDSIDNNMKLNDVIYQTIESVTDLRDNLKLDEPFKRGVSQGDLSFTDIIGESVKKILNEKLNEGSTINNKPKYGDKGKVDRQFDEDYPGDFEDLANDLYPEKKEDEKRNRFLKYLQNGAVHNKRAREKYDSDGNPTWGREGENLRAIKKQNGRKQEVKDIKRMLYYNNIDYQTYASLSPEIKKECWDTFNYYEKHPLAQQRLEWGRNGDPDWSTI